MTSEKLIETKGDQQQQPVETMGTEQLVPITTTNDDEPNNSNNNAPNVVDNNDDDDDDDEEDPYTDISSMSEENPPSHSHSSLELDITSNTNLHSSSGDNGNGEDANRLLEFGMSHSAGSGHTGDGGNVGDGGRRLEFARSHSSSSIPGNHYNNDKPANAATSTSNNNTTTATNNNNNNNTDSNDKQLLSNERLQCVEITTTTTEKPPSSPLGSVSVQSSSNNLSPVGKQSPQQLNMPRFYDSEEEGAGSLVFVTGGSVTGAGGGGMGGGGSGSVTGGGSGHYGTLSPKMGANHGNLFLRSSNSSEDGGSVVRVAVASSNPIISSSRMAQQQPELLLPYHQRKKLSQKEELQQPNMVVVPPVDHVAANVAGQLSVSPLAMPGAAAVAGGGGGGGGASSRPGSGLGFPPKPPPAHLGQIQPPPSLQHPQQQQQPMLQPPPQQMSMPPAPPPLTSIGVPPSPSSQAPPAASKYRVAPIPPFNKKGSGQNHERNPSISDLSEGGVSNNADNSAYNAYNPASAAGGNKGKGKKMRKVKSATNTPSSSRNNKGSSRNGRNANNRGGSGDANALGDGSPDKVLSPKSNAGNNNNVNGNNNGNGGGGNGGGERRPPLAPQMQIEVIDPNNNFGSNRDTTANNSNSAPPSPRSGYHIRISSQGSISSLGSNAGADSDAGLGGGNRGVLLHHHAGGMQQQQLQMGMQPQQQGMQHAGQGMQSHGNREYYSQNDYYMQQQQQQQYGHHPQQHSQGRGSQQPQQQQQQQQGGGYNVNYNAVLGHEVAHFLHGEQIASAAERSSSQSNMLPGKQHRQQQQQQRQQRHNNQWSPHHQQGHAPHGHHPQWHPHHAQQQQHGGYGHGGQPHHWGHHHHHQQQPHPHHQQHHHSQSQPQQQHGYPNQHPQPYPHHPQQQHPQPQAPPLTFLPNMSSWGDGRHHRERLPSVSEDDWEETLNENTNEDEDKNRGDNRGSGRGPPQHQYHHSMPQRGHYDQPPLQQQHYQQQQQQLPPRQQGGQHDRRHSSKGGGSRRNKSSGGLGDSRPLVGEQEPTETSGLLASPSGIRTYEGAGDYDMYGMQQQPHQHYPGQQSEHYHGMQQQQHGSGSYGAYDMPHQQQQQQQHRHHPSHHQQQQHGSGQTPRGGGDSKRKKSKRRNRREKRLEQEKRRSAYGFDTSDEDINLFSSGSDRRSGHNSSSGHTRSKKSKSSKRQGHRKRRSQPGIGGGGGGTPSQNDETLSETYSESLMSTSLADRSTKREAKGPLQQLLISTKLLVYNLPLSSAAISFSIVLLGTVWLKWAEEILPSCKEVNFHSSQCTFPEFPGCYFCDEYNAWYKLAKRFHAACGYIAGLSVLVFFAKATLCWRVFMDEMSSPTTASPMGLVFMTMALGFVGKGPGSLGAVLVFVASFLHLVLVVWFIYMSLAYQTMPDPSWFANTIGLGLCAVKIWFYCPLPGHFLIVFTLMLTILYYPISLIRVALNEKMSATICWINMMGPAVPLYALAIIMEPTFQQERPDISHFQTVQRSVYLPSMTCLFVLCIIGMVSSVHGLIVRWKQISREEFSPAHAAYSFPLLMHALAVQSYRSSLDFFAPPDEVSPTLKTALHIYWVFLVVTGTITAVTCIITYLIFLPSWVDVDTRDELEPPAPNETSICNSVTYGESLIQPYISPTILQANETGILIMAYDYQNGWCDLVRTRRIPAFGFEPMMSRRAFNRERNALKLFMGGQDVIQEGDEEGDDICFENELENGSGGV